jgi:hypothetical protein
MPADRSPPLVTAAIPARRLTSLLFGLILVGRSALTSASNQSAGGPLPGRRIDRIVAGSNRLFGLRGGDVVTFDAGGQPLGHCGGFLAPPKSEAHPLLVAPDAEEVLRAAGLPDDDSSAAAEEALEDEGLGPRRRTRPGPDLGVEPRALAASRAADTVWIATSSGIFRGDEDGCVAAGLDGRNLGLVAAAGGVVATASDDLLFRRDAEADGGGIDGATFTVAAGLASRPRALAIGESGETIVADDDGVLLVEVGNPPARILDRPTDAIAVCGGVAAVLSSDGVYTFRPGAPPTRVGDRPPARALACGRSAAERWIATGLGVWTSADGGAWTERTEMLGRSVASAAIVGDRLWLAVEDGLVALDAGTMTDDAMKDESMNDGAMTDGAAARSGLTGTPTGAALPALVTRKLSAPTIPWPWLTAVFTTEQTPDRRAWTAMLLLTFPLARSSGRRIDPTAVAGERVQRDRALAAEQVDLRDGGAPSDEIDARLTAIQQEREALR